MKITGELHSFDIEYEEITKTLVDSINRIMREAARAFYNAAIARIPVRTGFAAGAFRNILEAGHPLESNKAAAVFQRAGIKKFGRTASLIRTRIDKIKEKQDLNRLSREILKESISEKKDDLNLKKALAGAKKRAKALKVRLTGLKEKLKDVRQKILLFKLANPEVFRNFVSVGRKRLSTLSARIKGKRIETSGGALGAIQFLSQLIQRQTRKEGASKLAIPSKLRGEQESPTTELYYHKGKKYPKDIPTSQRFGTPPADIFIRQGNKFLFNFDSRIIYYKIEDVFGKNSPSAPWQSFTAGVTAFNLILNRLADKIPPPNEFVITTIHKIVGETIQRRVLPIKQTRIGVSVQEGKLVSPKTGKGKGITPPDKAVKDFPIRESTERERNLARLKARHAARRVKQVGTSKVIDSAQKKIEKMRAIQDKVLTILGNLKENTQRTKAERELLKKERVRARAEERKKKKKLGD